LQKLCVRFAVALGHIVLVGTSGDHKGPPFPAQPPSPLRDLMGFIYMIVVGNRVWHYTVFTWILELPLGADTSVGAINRPLRCQWSFNGDDPAGNNW
jgi:hypothetical protein